MRPEQASHKPHLTMQQAIILHCRAGFEKECAAEIIHHAEGLGVPGSAVAQPNTAHVIFTPQQGGSRELSGLRLSELVFARQIIFNCTRVHDLPPTDRLKPLLPHIPKKTFSAVVVETPDTNEAKSLSSFCRKFTPYLERELTQSASLKADDPALPRLNVLFVDAATAWVGLAWPNNASPWPMGIPRLRMPSAAPSRSTLKLYEAWLALMSEAEREKNLRGGMRAVDLGAAPGGWTWQLVQKGMLVTAVDNGRMDANLMAGGMVEHVRGDGFTFRPRKTVDWMVCDMVEKPSRIAELTATWLAEKRCLRAIVNFKLPMKKRFDEWLKILDIIEARTQAAGINVSIRAKQLYHDREELTAYIFRR